MKTDKDTINYQDYLANLHQANTTEDSIVKALIQDSLHENTVSKKRIIAGEVNEVYDLTLESNKQVILRISKKDTQDFLQEQWAIGQCRSQNIPVPVIIFVGNTEVKGKPVSFCIMEKLPGSTLERGTINHKALQPKVLQQIITEAGNLLKRIHTIPTQGFGDLDAKGNGEFQSFTKILSKDPNQKQGLLLLAKNTSIPQPTMESILDKLESVAEKNADAMPVLNHGDYGPKHLMISDNKISGIIDWGDSSGNSPLYDLARWEYWFGDEFPTSWLLDGYGHELLKDSKSLELFEAIKLRL